MGLRCRITAKNALCDFDCLLACEHHSTHDGGRRVRVVLERERSAEVACQGDAGPIGVAWGRQTRFGKQLARAATTCTSTGANPSMASAKQNENLLLTEHFTWPPIVRESAIRETGIVVLIQCATVSHRRHHQHGQRLAVQLQ
jgi:hypothetical protein